MPRHPHRFSEYVFINCPFDRAYWPILEAIILCVVQCRFVPRSALEELDLSRIELSTVSGLPRFNMSFELGLDLGCRIYGQGNLKTKTCLILDAEPYRYQAFISDIAGQDIQYHHNSPDQVLTTIRNWLVTASGHSNLPGPALIRRRFWEFSSALPEYCTGLGLDRHDLQFVEYVALVQEWLAVGESPGR